MPSQPSEEDGPMSVRPARPATDRASATLLQRRQLRHGAVAASWHPSSRMPRVEVLSACLLLPSRTTACGHLTSRRLTMGSCGLRRPLPPVPAAPH